MIQTREGENADLIDIYNGIRILDDVVFKSSKFQT